MLFTSGIEPQVAQHMFNDDDVQSQNLGVFQNDNQTTQCNTSSAVETVPTENQNYPPDMSSPYNAGIKYVDIKT